MRRDLLAAHIARATPERRKHDVGPEILAALVVWVIALVIAFYGDVVFLALFGE